VPILLALPLLHLFGLVRIPFPPFTTGGQIYVDSPEVYTRERLVNDRYDQDYWLRQRLEQLDNPDQLHLVVGTQSRALRGRFGDGGEGEDVAAEAEHAPRRLAFEQELRVAAGIRDMIRQQVLENMLDDRHDLTGNSVYGLKFDTTVIPGTNTRRRAFVHVQVTIRDIFATGAGGANAAEGGVGDTPGDAHAAPASGESDNALGRQRQYADWVKDVMRRLNQAEDSIFESLKDQCRTKDWEAAYFFDRLTGRTLEVVLGIPEERFWLLRQKQEQLIDDAESANESAPPLADVRWSLPAAGCRDLPRFRTPFLEIGTSDAGACLMKVKGNFLSSFGEYLAVVVGLPISRFRTMMGQPGEDAAAVETLPEQEGHEAPEPVMLPDPWSKYFTMERKLFRLHDPPISDQCAARVWFDVYELREAFIALDADWTEQQTNVDAPLRSMLDDLTIVGETLGGGWRLYVSDDDYALRERWFENATPKYDIEDRLLERLDLENKRHCLEAFADEKLCAYFDDAAVAELVRVVALPSGFLNFSNRLSSRDLYPYAIFPKNDVVGIFADTRAEVAAAAAGTGLLDFAQFRRESTTAAVLTGYGLGGGRFLNRDIDSSRSVNFGWIISARGDMEPTQKSQLALVSVPAWTDTLKLNVTVGWLDRDGAPDDDESFDLEIAVPPNLEAFDSIFREDAQVTLGPTIRDNEMDSRIYVRAGRPTAILIPGSRLWRSASVTLGAQTAERIQVLPNMEGIIAVFDDVALPYAAYDPGTDSGTPKSLGSGDEGAGPGLGNHSGGAEAAVDLPCDRDYVTGLHPALEELQVRSVRLRVWTSEGVAQARKRVCVVYSPSEVLKSGEDVAAGTE
jgi:hypothetical protein